MNKTYYMISTEDKKSFNFDTADDVLIFLSLVPKNYIFSISKAYENNKKTSFKRIFDRNVTNFSFKKI